MRAQRITDGMGRKIKTLVFLFLFLFIYGIAGHMVIFGDGPLEAFASTLETLAFHYETAPFLLGELYQISILLVGVIIFWWALWTVFDLVAEGKFKEYFLEVKLMSEIENLEDHYIICGAGRIGLHVAKLLGSQNERFVLIDQHDADVDAAKKHGFLIAKGEPFDESVLLNAGIKKARAVVTVLSETEKNILVTILTKELNPAAKIYARTEKGELSKTLKKLGADHVIMPEVAGAIDIVDAIKSDSKAAAAAEKK